MSRENSRWEDSALCAQTDPELFFPMAKHSPHPALRICAACPVREDCLETAMANERLTDRGHRFGIYGGLTSTQRAELARTRAQAGRSAA